MLIRPLVFNQVGKISQIQVYFQYSLLLASVNQNPMIQLLDNYQTENNHKKCRL